MEENFEAGALTKAELVDLLFEQMGMNKRSQDGGRWLF